MWLMTSRVRIGNLRLPNGMESESVLSNADEVHHSGMMTGVCCHPPHQQEAWSCCCLVQLVAKKKKNDIYTCIYIYECFRQKVHLITVQVFFFFFGDIWENNVGEDAARYQWIRFDCQLLLNFKEEEKDFPHKMPLEFHRCCENARIGVVFLVLFGWGGGGGGGSVVKFTSIVFSVCS